MENGKNYHMIFINNVYYYIWESFNEVLSGLFIFHRKYIGVSNNYLKSGFKI